MKLWAYDRISTQMEAQVPKGELVAVSPTLFNTLLWRALIETEKGYFITYWSPFDKNEDKTKFEFIAKNHQLAKKFQSEEDFKTLKWFSRANGGMLSRWQIVSELLRASARHAWPR